MSYVVTSPLVIAHTPNGDRHVYDGGQIPDDTDAEQVKQLLESGQIAKGEAGQPADSGDGPAGAPAKSAAKAEWVDYAVSQGADREQAEASTKDELVERYGD